MQEVVGSIPIGSIEFDPSRSYRGGSFDLEHGIALEGETQYLRYRTKLSMADIGVTGWFMRSIRADCISKFVLFRSTERHDELSEPEVLPFTIAGPDPARRENQATIWNHEFLELRSSIMSEHGFDRREEGFEAKLQAEGDQKFRLEMRRDKLFAEWVAGQLELSGDECEAYKASIIKADLQEPGDQDVIAKVHADLATAGIEISKEDLQAELDLCHEDAAAEEA